VGEAGEIVWYPDRTWHGRTYVPATAPTSTGYELFGYVRFLPAGDGGEPSDFSAHVDFTDETAERNPDWLMDLCDEVVGAWRGHFGAVAAMTLVWGHPLISGGRIATAELADLAVDQCELIDERFTLIAPDDYRHDLLQIKLFGVKGQELARESLYAEEEEEDEEEEDEEDGAAVRGRRGAPRRTSRGPARVRADRRVGLAAPLLGVAGGECLQLCRGRTRRSQDDVDAHFLGGRPRAGEVTACGFVADPFRPGLQLL